MMTRKLTTNERTHGARAYSHNASRRAHQLSGPRRERVVCRPEGDAALNNAPPAGAEANLDAAWEAACDECGYLTCVHRAIEASTSAAPKPSPAPVVERQAHRFVVGQRVRCVEGSRGLARGSEHVIERIDYDSQKLPYLVLENDENLGGWLAQRFEPLTSERGAQESDGWTPPSGWTLSKPFEGRVQWTYETGAAAWMLDSNPAWFWAKEDQDFAEHGDRCATLAQACAAALGITLERSPGAPSLWDARLGDALIVHSADDPESCARAAVEAWSAMQREGA